MPIARLQSLETTPHIAFEVDDLDLNSRAGKSRAAGLAVARREGGDDRPQRRPIELIEFRRTSALINDFPPGAAFPSRVC
jgi:hypothetical protein